MSRFDPKPYEHDGGFSILGLPIVLIMLLTCALALGWLASFLGQWFYLVFVFPAGMGIALFAVGLFAARLARLRNLTLAFLFALLAGTATIGTLHYCDYRRARDQVEELIQSLPPRAGQAALKVPQGVFDHLQMQATEGITIGRRGGGINLGYYGTWIYWSLEWLAVVLLAWMGLVVTAGEPYCSTCQRWKETRTLGSLSCHNAEPDAVAEFLRTGDLDQLEEHQPSKLSGGDLVLSVAVCPGCQDHGPIDVKMEHLTHNAKGEESKNELAHVTYPGEALAEFEEMFSKVIKLKKKRRPREDDEDEDDEDDER